MPAAADPVLAALDLIERGTRSARSLEGQELDFKTEKGSDKETFQDLAEAAVCFANGSGGTIVLGVTDTGTGSAAFVGTAIQTEALRSRLHALTQPNLVVIVEELERCGKRLLRIRVPEGLDVYATSKGLVTRRWADQCLPMSPVDVGRLNDERRGTDWTSQPSRRRPDEVNAEAMLRARRLLASTTGAARALASTPHIDVLNGLRLVAANGNLTRAGEILLCEDAEDVSREILVYQYRQTPGGEAVSVKRWGTPMLLAYTEAMEAITARVGITPVNTSGGQQLQIEDYPVAAVREALANALLHGDYRERRPVQIEHSPDALVVSSPGPLVNGITPENIITAGSKARFPSLASAARTVGLAEELGQGVDRMFREMVRTGRALPEVRVQHDSTEPSTIVRFRGGPPNARVARFVSELPEDESNDTDALLIVTLLCQKPSVTARDVAPVVQRDLTSTEAVLRRLANGDAELLEATAGTANRAHPNYRLRATALSKLGTAVAYHRRTTSDVDRKVTDHVREYDSINSATIQRLFDVDVYQARDILSDLVRRRVLVRTSTQTRGPMVKYGAGEEFPEKEKSRRRATKGRPD